MSATHETPQPAVETPERRGFPSRRVVGYLGGFLLGLLTVWSLIVMIFVSVPTDSRELRRRVVCTLNLRDIGMAIAMYHAENEDLPALSPQDLVRAGSSWKMFVCPSAIHELGDDEEYSRKDVDYVLIPLDGNAPGTLAAVFELPANHRQKICNWGRSDMSVASDETPIEFLSAVQKANDYHAELRGKP